MAIKATMRAGAPLGDQLQPAIWPLMIAGESTKLTSSPGRRWPRGPVVSIQLDCPGIELRRKSPKFFFGV
jgi:hypothetical protein